MKNPRSILITGASGGIGAALARAYAGPGVALALVSRNADRLERVAEPCRRAGAEVRTAQLDVAEAEPLQAWIEAIDRSRPLDLVIANAGITGGLAKDGSGESPSDVRRMMSINFAGACNTIHPLIPAMRRRGRGQIALMSSIAAHRGLPYSPAYCASKAALRAYGEALGAWLRPQGVDVSVILPGFVDTHLSGHVSGPKPLQLTPERAARIVVRGLARRRARIAFPLLLDIGMRILGALPPALVDPALNAVRVDIRRYE
ncbi:MAG TPA: SDR family NAD(P)-dependent oxidoreductase [Stellaceae bacterium]|nr:SDR family NAD(P)-dependent oxidoreductase [Stellaceae bacterium]